MNSKRDYLKTKYPRVSHAIPFRKKKRKPIIPSFLILDMILSFFSGLIICLVCGLKKMKAHLTTGPPMRTILTLFFYCILRHSYIFETRIRLRDGAINECLFCFYICKKRSLFWHESEEHLVDLTPNFQMRNQISAILVYLSK